MTRYKHLIIGAGHAACVAALQIRSHAPGDSIAMVGDEPFAPYERPALSKGFLTGDRGVNDLTIRTAEALNAEGIVCLLGERIRQIEPDSRSVSLGSGTRLGYENLLIATGSRTRPLPPPGPDIGNIHYLRGIEDSLGLKSALQTCADLVVIGAGFIGLEVAATARRHFGCRVTVVEAGPDILMRGASAELRQHLLELHQSNGVDFRLDTAVSGFSKYGQDRIAVTTADGNRLAADTALVCIGVIPNTELAEEAGIDTQDGIVTDAFGATNVEHIWAAGEVARHPAGLGGELTRYESWQMAQTQAATVGRNMAGGSERISYVPWFWTDQYGHNFQMIGSLGPVMETRVRAYGEGLKSTTVYLKEGCIAGALCVDTPQDMPPLRRAIEAKRRIDPNALADTSLKLKKILA